MMDIYPKNTKNILLTYPFFVMIIPPNFWMVIKLSMYYITTNTVELEGGRGLKCSLNIE